ncbi:hypothetical protein GOP47_0027840 [Adiantum capillus-veneris]|nr:hypothetical protein GOP47_0027840 [Adiantum capillus-veneris]
MLSHAESTNQYYIEEDDGPAELEAFDYHLLQQVSAHDLRRKDCEGVADADVYNGTSSTYFETLDFDSYGSHRTPDSYQQSDLLQAPSPASASTGGTSNNQEEMCVRYVSNMNAACCSTDLHVGTAADVPASTSNWPADFMHNWAGDSWFNMAMSDVQSPKCWVDKAGAMGGRYWLPVDHREFIYRTAAMQPIDLKGIDKSSIASTAAAAGIKPRKNIHISKDPQSVAARQRRRRVSEKIRVLQRLVPGGAKLDTAAMLEEAAQYVKFLKAEVEKMEAMEDWMSLKAAASPNLMDMHVAAGYRSPPSICLSTGMDHFF